MNRRDCIKLASIAAGAALIGPLTLALAAGGKKQRRFGLQLFTVRDNLTRDPIKTLGEIAEIGFKEIEMFGFGGSIFSKDPLFGLSAKELRTVLDDLGLSVPSTTIAGDMDIAASGAQIDTAHELGIKYFVIAMAPEFRTFAEGVTGVERSDQVKPIAERLNKQGYECKEAGLTLAYHNHNMEFEPLADMDDLLAYDYMLQLADPDLVKIEFDIGWATGANIDPVDYLLRYDRRVIATHIKDFNPGLPVGQDPKKYPIPIMKQMAEVGTGIVDFKRVLSAMDKIGVQHGFMEIDVPETPMDSIRRGLRYLEKL